MPIGLVQFIFSLCVFALVKIATGRTIRSKQSPAVGNPALLVADRSTAKEMVLVLWDTRSCSWFRRGGTVFVLSLQIEQDGHALRAGSEASA